MTDRKQLGKILLKRKLISPEELERALTSQKSAPPGAMKPLASVLMESGSITELEALKGLSEQFGVPGLELSQIAIDLAHLDFVPREVAEERQMLPVLVHEDQLFLAMANPTDQRAIDELEFVTGRKVRPYIALTAALEVATRRAYDAKEAGRRHYFGPNVPEDTKRQLLGTYGNVARASVPPPEAESFDLASDSAARGSGAGHEPREPEASPHAASLGTLGPGDWSSVASLPQEEPKRPRTSGRTILVVDDEDDIRKLLVRVLKNEGHIVIEATRGLEALERVKEHMPDLIVLDAMLPELHGFEIARRLKSSEKYGGIPILLVSAVHRGWRVAEDAKSNLKIDEYLEKPFKISDVTAAVARLLTKEEKTSRDPEELADEARRLLEEGVLAYREGDMKRATVALRRATEVDPLAFRARYHLGLLYAKVGQLFEGISELERAIELHPKSFAALKNLAVLYEQAGFRNKAVEVWERCVQATADTTVQREIREHLLQLL